MLLALVSDFYHACDLTFVFIKWASALAVEYIIAQPLMVFVELKMMLKYDDVFIPRDHTTTTERPYIDEEAWEDEEAADFIQSNESTPLKVGYK